jgi:hypothetical protein
MVHSVAPCRRPKASAYWPSLAAEMVQAGSTVFVHPPAVTAHPTLVVA